MKRLGLIGGIVVLLVIIIAALMAGKMGETSHAVARGKVVLADELTDKAQGITTLFVIVSGLDRPMPIAALRKSLTAGVKGVVYEFVITNESAQKMDMTAPWPAEFKLKARLDQDGQGGMDQPGDLTGELYPVKNGATDVVLKIDKLIPYPDQQAPAP